MGCDILASRFITRKLAFSIELSSNLANFYFKIIEHDRPSNLPALHRYIQSFRQSPVERGGEGSGDFINVTIKFTWTPYNALHNLVPRSYRVTDWNVILPVKGLVTRLALQYSDDPSPPPSLTFYDLPSTVVVCNYQYCKYMQVIRLIHTTAKFERSRTASLFLLLNDHWHFQVKY